jgi:hypothetical protein
VSEFIALLRAMIDPVASYTDGINITTSSTPIHFEEENMPLSPQAELSPPRLRAQVLDRFKVPDLLCPLSSNRLMVDLIRQLVGPP